MKKETKWDRQNTKEFQVSVVLLSLLFPFGLFEDKTPKTTEIRYPIHLLHRSIYFWETITYLSLHWLSKYLHNLSSVIFFKSRQFYCQNNSHFVICITSFSLFGNHSFFQNDGSISCGLASSHNSKRCFSPVVKFKPRNYKKNHKKMIS